MRDGTVPWVKVFSGDTDDYIGINACDYDPELWTLWSPEAVALRVKMRADAAKKVPKKAKE